MLQNYSEIKSLLNRIFVLLEEESLRSVQIQERLERRIEILEKQLKELKNIPSETNTESDLHRNYFPEAKSVTPLEEPSAEESTQNTLVEVGAEFWEEDEETQISDESDHKWMTDRPGEAVDDIYEAISFSDRIYFIRDLFMEDEEQYELTMDRINSARSFAEVVSEMRAAFEWDEESDAVYRFYMAVRRKYV